MSTNIQWTDETWNPIVGCSRVSPGCQKCYAATAAASARLQRFPQYQAVKDWNGSVQFVESQRLKPLHWRQPKKIFVCSMADLFHENVIDEWIDQVLAIAALCPQHTFQILTKRPQRALDYIGNKKTGKGRPYSIIWNVIQQIGMKPGIPYSSDYMRWPLPNLWIGVSAENQLMADERIPILLQIPARVRFLSCEPLLGAVDLKFNTACLLNWVIVGGESGSNSRPCHIEWLQSIVQQCQSTKTPVFVKQLGANAYFQQQQFKTRNKKGGDISEFPLQIQVREFPNFICN